MAMPNCFRLLRHWLRRAASRAAWTAGSSRAMSVAMMAITTNNSISVKPERLVRSDASRVIVELLRTGTAKKKTTTRKRFKDAVDYGFTPEECFAGVRARLRLHETLIN